MAHKEGASVTGEAPFSNRVFYDRAVRALLSHARYRGDAHRLFGDIDLISEDGTRQPGTYGLSDYYAWCSSSFVYRHVEPYGADPEEQRRLLELQDTAMSIQLYKDNQFVSPYYLLFWAHNLRAGSTLHETIYPGKDWNPPIALPETWPAEQPVIVRADVTNTMNDSPSLVFEAGREAQLREIYQALSE